MVQNYIDESRFSFATFLPRECPVVPVLALESADEVEPVVEILSRSGFGIIEITMRTPAALKAIERAASLDSPIVVGAGTLLWPEQARQARDAGAAFLVSPGYTSALAEAAVESGLPFLPGVATPGEVLAAAGDGFRELKLFPAGLLGGLTFLAHLAPIFPEVRFCVTGGITAGNLIDYLSQPNCFAAGGSFMAPHGLLRAQRWSELEEVARQIRELSKLSSAELHESGNK